MCRLSGPLTTFADTIGLSRLSQPLREKNPIGRRGLHDFRAHYRAFRFPTSGYGANWLGNGRFLVPQFWRDRGRYGGLTCYISAHGSRLICPYKALQCPKNGRKNVGGVSSATGVKTGRKTPLNALEQCADTLGAGIAQYGRTPYLEHKRRADNRRSRGVGG